ncbi:HET-domain-containing protein [Podospora aff. communis PSN243]|uniref:HET-domain-containing protein n=1 Tax=Podospora aff. communis PSN243 TaxID=3040156 RepID=A0AAV9G534_9PEZI|nr:HET-domain-containing protein [Podospora aff. communis PSN243]
MPFDSIGHLTPDEDPFTPNNPDWTYILDPSRQGDPLQLLQEFLLNGGELSALSRHHTNDSNLLKAPCLYVAAHLGNTAAVKFLLDSKGVDVETRYHDPSLDYEKTALHAAAEQARCSVARALIERGANVQATDRVGRSAIYYAAKSGRKSILHLLASAGGPLGLKEVTEVYEASQRDELVDTFWFSVIHGKHQFPAPDTSAFAKPTPAWIKASVGRRWLGNQMVRDLETRLLAAAFPRQDLGLCGGAEREHELCKDCASLALQQPEEFMGRKSRIAAWKDAKDSFTYGFLPRCGMCRIELLNPEVLPEELSETPLSPGINADERRYKDDDDLCCLLTGIQTGGLGFGDPTATYSLASYWLLRCLKGHQECTAVLEPLKLPRRVVDVRISGDSSPVSLYESHPGETGNLEQFKRAVPEDKLSQTIRDAITVTRSLGFRYLWVDALCILQDSPEEWESEIKTMDEVYSKALLTIAADVEVSDDGTGFLKPSTPQGESGSRPTGILDTRGWVLQEQILSSRTLSFTDSGAYWTCAGLNASIAQPGGFLHQDHMREPKLRQLQRQLQGHDRTGTFWKSALYKGWALMVTDYSRRDLTVEGDRLSALMGIQIVFGKALDDECLVGLWRNNMAQQLLWWVAKDEDLYSGNTPLRNGSSIYPFGRPAKPSFERPTAFTAPTWSWASVRGPITYARAIDAGYTCYLSIPAYGHSADEKEIQVHEVTLDTSGPQSFRGSIRLTGSIMKASSFVNAENHPMIKAEAFCVSCTLHPTGGSHGQVVQEPWYPDVLPAHEGEIFCLLLKNAFDQWSLCLVPSGNGPNEYKRVGVCKWRAHDRHWRKLDGGDLFLDVAAPDRRRVKVFGRDKRMEPFLYSNAWTETIVIV